MTISVFDLFKVGIGPSSSHTVGPMRAACSFAARLSDQGLLTRVAAVRCELFGSLGATGHGHGSVKAVVLGLEGDQPDLVDPVAAEPRVVAVRSPPPAITWARRSNTSATTCESSRPPTMASAIRPRQPSAAPGHGQQDGRLPRPAATRRRDETNQPTTGGMTHHD